MQRYVLEYAGAAHEAEVEQKGDGLYSVTVDGRTLEVDARLVEQTVLSLIVEGACREVHFSKERGAYTLLIGGKHYSTEGQVVTAGQKLVVVE